MRIVNKTSKILATIMLGIVLTLVAVQQVFALGNGADVRYANPDTGYVVIIDDQADLLTASEEADLVEDMKPITEFGSAIFASIDSNSSSTAAYARNYFHATLGSGVEDGTLFLIDMDNRNIYIFSDGVIYKTITDSVADTITDNIYKAASAAEYYRCASEAFEQIYKVLNGQKIAQPMKYISNALISILLGMLVCFIIINAASGLKRPADAELLSKAHLQFTMGKAAEVKGHTTKTYSPQSSGGGGSSGGGSSGGGGGGGGGSSGGGGGHSF